MKRAALLSAALAAPLAAAGDDPLAGYAPTGITARCLGDTDLSPVVLDRHTIGLRRTGRRWWISRIGDHCPSLRPYATLIVIRHGGPLCDTDRFQVLEPGSSIPSAACRFSPFEAYDRAPRR